ncbi:hypothetical protein [Dokdonella sp.]|uniref:hypothetical protein n=1 Tax=Dokdonella sp. TaxID=2291710 RepID=UPI002F42551C
MNTHRDPRLEPRTGDVIWFRYPRSRTWQCAIVDRVEQGRVYYTRSAIGAGHGEHVWIDVDGWKQRAGRSLLRFPLGRPLARRSA